MQRPVSGAPHMPISSPSWFHQSTKRCLVCSQLAFHIPVLVMSVRCRNSIPRSGKLNSLVACRFDRLLLGGMNSLFGEIVVNFAFAFLEDGGLFLGAAAIHRLLPDLFEQFEDFLFVFLRQIGISRQVAGIGELNLAVGHIVLDLLHLCLLYTSPS